MKSIITSLVLAVAVQAVVVFSVQGPSQVQEAISPLSVQELANFDRWRFRNRSNPNHGPSCRATCRILNNGACGSGTIVGIDSNGYALVLTNAHVAGSKLGKLVKIEVESTGTKLRGRVIMAAYSDKYLADWAILRTTTRFNKVKPVKLNTQRPTGSHYTKGFPRCKPMPAGNVEMVMLSKRTPLAKWRPNAIGGQSGSGVFNDKTGYVECLLTWSWSGYGAGQMTSEMYKQALGRTARGAVRTEGLVEIIDLDCGCCGLEAEKPHVENGFFAQCNITDLPIWANVPSK